MRAFRLAYDGRPFHGFQRQPDVPTVEDTVFDALRDLGALDGDVPDGYAAAGRTDAGVSAVAQTIAFEAPEWLTPRALNGGLPGTVRAWASADVPAAFHATHHAHAREYTYHLYAPDADDELARQALDALCGRHDFHNLTPADEHTERDLAGSVTRDGEYLVLTLRAGGFVHELVRRVVSLVHAVAADETPLSKIDRVLGPDAIDGPAGVAPAPAYPLVLTDVEYDVVFTVDPEAAASARTAFEERRVERATSARVADEVVRGIPRE